MYLQDWMIPPYPLVMQHNYWKWSIDSWFTHLKIVMFHSYVGLPKGIWLKNISDGKYGEYLINMWYPPNFCYIRYQHSCAACFNGLPRPAHAKPCRNSRHFCWNWWKPHIFCAFWVPKKPHVLENYHPGGRTTKRSRGMWLIASVLFQFRRVSLDVKLPWWGFKHRKLPKLPLLLVPWWSWCSFPSSIIHHNWQVWILHYSPRKKMFTSKIIKQHKTTPKFI